ncbi:hypothetical protein KKB44_03840 [Candidatus Micrarchaeota archaeon]|nr:hypothetical protein [Candidatus Micrarchaeota archaeon]
MGRLEQVEPIEEQVAGTVDLAQQMGPAPIEPEERSLDQVAEHTDAAVDQLQEWVRELEGGVGTEVIEDRIRTIESGLENIATIEIGGERRYTEEVREIEELVQNAQRQIERNNPDEALRYLREADAKLQGLTDIVSLHRRLSTIGATPEMLDAVEASFADYGTPNQRRAELLRDVTEFYVANYDILRAEDAQQITNQITGLIVGIGQASGQPLQEEVFGEGEQQIRQTLEELDGRFRALRTTEMDETSYRLELWSTGLLSMRMTRDTSEEWRRATTAIYTDIQTRIQEGGQVTAEELRLLEARMTYVQNASDHLNSVSDRNRTSGASTIYARGLDALTQGNTDQAELQGLLARHYVSAGSEDRERVENWSSRAAGEYDVVRREVGNYIADNIDGRRRNTRDEQILSSLDGVNERLRSEDITLEDLQRGHIAFETLEQLQSSEMRSADSNVRAGATLIYSRVFAGLGSGVPLEYVQAQSQLADMYLHPRRYTMPPADADMSAAEVCEFKREEIERVSQRAELMAVHDLVARQNLTIEEATLRLGGGRAEELAERYRRLGETNEERQQGIERIGNDVQTYFMVSRIMIETTLEHARAIRQNDTSTRMMYFGLNVQLDTVLMAIANGREISAEEQRRIGALIALYNGTPERAAQYLAGDGGDVERFLSLLEGTGNISGAMSGLSGRRRGEAARIYENALARIDNDDFEGAATHIIAAQAYIRADTNEERERIVDLSRTAYRLQGEEEVEGALPQANMQWELRMLFESNGHEIADETLRRNATEYYNLAVIAYNRGDFTGASLLRTVGDIYGRAAATGVDDPTIQNILALVNGNEELRIPSLEELRTNYGAEQSQTIAQLMGLEEENVRHDLDVLGIRLADINADLELVEFRQRRIDADSADYTARRERLERRGERTDDELERERLEGEIEITNLDRNLQRFDESARLYEESVRLFHQSTDLRRQAVETEDEAERTRLNAEADQLLRRSMLLRQAANGEQQAILEIHRSITTVDTIHEEAGCAALDRSFERFASIAAAVEEAPEITTEIITLEDARLTLGFDGIALGSAQIDEQVQIGDTRDRMLRNTRRLTRTNEQNATEYEGVILVTGRYSGTPQAAYNQEAIQADINRAASLIRAERFVEGSRATSVASSNMGIEYQQADISRRHDGLMEGASGYEQTVGLLNQFDTFALLGELQRARVLVRGGRFREADSVVGDVRNQVLIQGERQVWYNQRSRLEARIEDLRERETGYREFGENIPSTGDRVADDAQEDIIDGVRRLGIHTNLADDVDTLADVYEVEVQEIDEHIRAIDTVEEARDSQYGRTVARGVPDEERARHARRLIQSPAAGTTLADAFRERTDEMTERIAELDTFSEVGARAYVLSIGETALNMDFQDRAVGWNYSMITLSAGIDYLTWADQMARGRVGHHLVREGLRENWASEMFRASAWASTNTRLVNDRISRVGGLDTAHFPGIYRDGNSRHTFREGTAHGAETVRINMGQDTIDVAGVLLEVPRGVYNALQDVADTTGTRYGPGGLLEYFEEADALAINEYQATMASLGFRTWYDHDAVRWQVERMPEFSEEHHEAMQDVQQQLANARGMFAQTVIQLGGSIWSMDDADEAFQAIGGMIDDTNRIAAPLYDTNPENWPTEEELASMHNELESIRTETARVVREHQEEGISDAIWAGRAWAVGTILVGGLLCATGYGTVAAPFFFVEAIRGFQDQTIRAGGYEYLSTRERVLGWGGIALAGIALPFAELGAVSQMINAEVQLGTRTMTSGLQLFNRGLQIGGYGMMIAGGGLGVLQYTELRHQDSRGANIGLFDYALTIFGAAQPGLQIGGTQIIRIRPSLGTSRSYGARAYRGFMMVAFGAQREEMVGAAMIGRQERYSRVIGGTTEENRVAIGHVEQNIGRHIETNEALALIQHYGDAPINPQEAQRLLNGHGAYVEREFRGLYGAHAEDTFSTLDRIGMERGVPVTTDEMIALMNHFGEGLNTTEPTQIHRFLEQREAGRAPTTEARFMDFENYLTSPEATQPREGMGGLRGVAQRRELGQTSTELEGHVNIRVGSGDEPDTFALPREPEVHYSREQMEFSRDSAAAAEYMIRHNDQIPDGTPAAIAEAARTLRANEDFVRVTRDGNREEQMRISFEVSNGNPQFAQEYLGRYSERIARDHSSARELSPEETREAIQETATLTDQYYEYARAREEGIVSADELRQRVNASDEALTEFERIYNNEDITPEGIRNEIADFATFRIMDRGIMQEVDAVIAEEAAPAVHPELDQELGQTRSFRPNEVRETGTEIYEMARSETPIDQIPAEYQEAVRATREAPEADQPRIVREQAERLLYERSFAELDNAIRERRVGADVAGDARLLLRTLHGRPVPEEVSGRYVQLLDEVQTRVNSGMTEIDAVLEVAPRAREMGITPIVGPSTLDVTNNIIARLERSGVEITPERELAIGNAVRDLRDGDITLGQFWERINIEESQFTREFRDLGDEFEVVLQNPEHLNMFVDITAEALPAMFRADGLEGLSPDTTVQVSFISTDLNRQGFLNALSRDPQLRIMGDANMYEYCLALRNAPDAVNERLRTEGIDAVVTSAAYGRSSDEAGFIIIARDEQSRTRARAILDEEMTRIYGNFEGSVLDQLTVDHPIRPYLEDIFRGGRVGMDEAITEISVADLQTLTHDGTTADFVANMRRLAEAPHQPGEEGARVISGVPTEEDMPPASLHLLNNDTLATGYGERNQELGREYTEDVQQRLFDMFVGERMENDSVVLFQGELAVEPGSEAHRILQERAARKGKVYGATEDGRVLLASANMIAQGTGDEFLFVHRSSIDYARQQFAEAHGIPLENIEIIQTGVGPDFSMRIRGSRITQADANELLGYYREGGRMQLGDDFTVSVNGMLLVGEEMNHQNFASGMRYLKEGTGLGELEVPPGGQLVEISAIPEGFRARSIEMDGGGQILAQYLSSDVSDPILAARLSELVGPEFVEQFRQHLRDEGTRGIRTWEDMRGVLETFPNGEEILTRLSGDEFLGWLGERYHDVSVRDATRVLRGSVEAEVIEQRIAVGAEDIVVEPVLEPTQPFREVRSEPVEAPRSEEARIAPEILEQIRRGASLEEIIDGLIQTDPSTARRLEEVFRPVIGAEESQNTRRFNMASPEERAIIMRELANGEVAEDAFAIMALETVPQDRTEILEFADSLRRRVGSGQITREELELRLVGIMGRDTGLGQLLWTLTADGTPQLVRERLAAHWPAAQEERERMNAIREARRSRPPEQVRAEEEALIRDLAGRMNLDAEEVVRIYGEGGTDGRLRVLDAIGIDVTEWANIVDAQRQIDALPLDATVPRELQERAARILEIDSLTGNFFDLVMRGNLESQLAGVPGFEGTTITGVNHIGGMRGIYSVEMSNGRRLFVKMESYEAANFGRELCLAEGLYTSGIRPGEYDTGLSIHIGDESEHVIRNFTIIEDIHDSVGSEISIRLPNGQTENVTVEGVQMFLHDIYNNPDPANPVHQEFFRMLGTETGRQELFQAWRAYHEMSRRALLMDRAPRNTAVVMVRRENGETMLTFQPIDMDYIGGHIGATPDWTPEYTGFNQDFARGTSELIQILAYVSHEASRLETPLGRPLLEGGPLGATTLYRDMFSETAELGARLPQDSPEMQGNLSTVVTVHDGLPYGVAMDVESTSGLGIGDFVRQGGSDSTIIVDRDGRTILHADSFLELYRDASTSVRQEEFIRSQDEMIRQMMPGIGEAERVTMRQPVLEPTQPILGPEPEPIRPEPPPTEPLVRPEVARTEIAEEVMADVMDGNVDAFRALAPEDQQRVGFEVAERLDLRIQDNLAEFARDLVLYELHANGERVIDDPAVLARVERNARLMETLPEPVQEALRPLTTHRGFRANATNDRAFGRYIRNRRTGRPLVETAQEEMIRALPVSEEVHDVTSEMVVGSRYSQEGVRSIVEDAIRERNWSVSSVENVEGYPDVFEVRIVREDGTSVDYIYRPREYTQERLGAALYDSIGEIRPEYILLEDGTALEQRVGEMDLRRALRDPSTSEEQIIGLLRAFGRQGVIDFALGIPDSHGGNYRVNITGDNIEVFRIDFENAGIGWGNGIRPGGEGSTRDSVLFWREIAQMIDNGTYTEGRLRAFIEGINEGFAAIEQMNIISIVQGAEEFNGTVMARNAGETAEITFDINTVADRIQAIQENPGQARIEMLESMFFLYRVGLMRENTVATNEVLGILRSELPNCSSDILQRWGSEFEGVVEGARDPRVRAGTEEILALVNGELERRANIIGETELPENIRYTGTEVREGREVARFEYQTPHGETEEIAIAAPEATVEARPYFERELELAILERREARMNLLDHWEGLLRGTDRVLEDLITSIEGGERTLESIRQDYPEYYEGMQEIMSRPEGEERSAMIQTHAQRIQNERALELESIRATREYIDEGIAPDQARTMVEERVEEARRYGRMTEPETIEDRFFMGAIDDAVEVSGLPREVVAFRFREEYSRQAMRIQELGSRPTDTTDALVYDFALSRAQQDGRAVPDQNDFVFGVLAQRGFGQVAPDVVTGIEYIRTNAPPENVAAFSEQYMRTVAGLDTLFHYRNLSDPIELTTIRTVFDFAAQLHTYGIDALPLLTNEIRPGVRIGILDSFPLTNTGQIHRMNRALETLSRIANQVPVESRGTLLEPALTYMINDVSRIIPSEREMYLAVIERNFVWSPEMAQRMEGLVGQAPRPNRLPFIAYMLPEMGIVPRELVLSALDNDHVRSDLRDHNRFRAVTELIMGIERGVNLAGGEAWLRMVGAHLEYARDGGRTGRRDFVRNRLPEINRFTDYYIQGRIGGEILAEISGGLTPSRNDQGQYQHMTNEEFRQRIGQVISERFLPEGVELSPEFIMENLDLIIQVSSFRDNLVGPARASIERLIGFFGEVEGFDQAAAVLDQALSARAQGEEAFRDFKFSEDFHRELQGLVGEERGDAIFSRWRGDHSNEIEVADTTYVVTESGSFEDGFRGGIVRGEATCQDPSGQQYHIVGIVGTVELPWVKQIIIRNEEGQIIYRRRLFLVNGDNGEPILLAQPFYAARDMPNIREIDTQVMGALQERYGELGIEVRNVRNAYSTDEGINTGYETFMSGRSPFFYIDGNAYRVAAGEMTFARNGLHYRREGEAVEFPIGWSGEHLIGAE